jgi:hypothetical protein
MNTQKRPITTFLAITTVLAAGVLSGCQYCEPLLMASLVIGAICKGLAYSPLASSTSAETKHINQ